MADRRMEKKSEQEQNLKNCIETVSEQILKIARNELYLNMRFLDVALSSLAFVIDEAVRPLDGRLLSVLSSTVSGRYVQRGTDFSQPGIPSHRIALYLPPSDPT